MYIVKENRPTLLVSFAFTWYIKLSNQQKNLKILILIGPKVNDFQIEILKKMQFVYYSKGDFTLFSILQNFLLEHLPNFI